MAKQLSNQTSEQDLKVIAMFDAPAADDDYSTRPYDDDDGYPPEEPEPPEPDPIEVTNENSRGYVYVATHPRTPEMIKIGFTNDVQRRMPELSQGFPEDYVPLFVMATPYPRYAEKLCHRALASDRVVSDKENFYCTSVPVEREYECPDTGAVYVDTALPFMDLAESLCRVLARAGVPIAEISGNEFPARRRA